MTRSRATGTEAVRDLFDATAQHWRQVYEVGTTEARIYQRRQMVAVEMTRHAAAGAPGRALEVGCGAGAMTEQLASDAWRVDAIDLSEAMVDQTRRRVEAAGLAERVCVAVGDAEHLDRPAGHYDLCIALGVLPWVADPRRVLAELARVTRPGGWLVVTSDNQLRLTHLVDPALNPVFRPLRRILGGLLRGIGVRRPLPLAQERRYRARTVDRMLRSAGFEVVMRRTTGFWPFTLFERQLFGEQRALQIDERLQRWADGSVPLLRGGGNHYVVLARRSASGCPGRR